MINLALWCFYFAGLGGFFEASAYVDASGAAISEFERLVPMMADQLLGGVSDAAQRLASGDFSGDQASVDVHIDGVATLATAFKGKGVPAAITDAFLGYLKTARGRGDGTRDVASVFPALRGTDSSSVTDI